MGRSREAHGVGVRDLDVARLDGPAADAVIAVLGAVSRGEGRFRGLARRVVSVRTVARLGRPADEGAGQDEADQNRGDECPHRKTPNR